MRRRIALALLAALAAAGCGGSDERPTREEARQCLERAGLRVTGAEPGPGDSDAPDAELIANDVRGHSAMMVFAAYYDDEARAERLEPALRRNARRFDGFVERHGALTLLWVRGRESRTGKRARGCLL